MSSEFGWYQYQDGVLTISLAPATPIGGWTIQFLVTRRAGSFSGGLITKSVASGYNNQSGINVINSGLGIFNVTLKSVDSSGLEIGPYFYSATRMDSGSHTPLRQDYLLLNPGN